MGNGNMKNVFYENLDEGMKSTILDTFLAKYADTNITKKTICKNFRPEYGQNTKVVYYLEEKDVNICFDDMKSCINFVAKLKRPFIICNDANTGDELICFVYAM